jgi:Proteasome subunit
VASIYDCRYLLTCCTLLCNVGVVHAIITTEYEDDITVDDAIKLVCAAITAGIDNDLGSGSNVDICIITKDSTKYTRAFKRNIFSNNAAAHHKHVPHKGVRANIATDNATSTAIDESSSDSSTANDHTISSIERKQQQQQQSHWFNKEVVRPSIVTLHTSVASSGSSRRVTDDTIELL